MVLTGWAGQISFGQMALAGIGAAVSATLTSRWHVDLSLSLVLGGLAGGVAAFLVGLPALRVRGMYLAVTTFALALATEYWLLNDRFFGWFPRGRAGFERAPAVRAGSRRHAHPLLRVLASSCWPSSTWRCAASAARAPGG